MELLQGRSCYGIATRSGGGDIELAMDSTGSGRRYLPAAGHDFFLPAYDPLMRVLGFRRFMDALIDQAELQSGFRVLDVGCGTGTLAIRLLQRFPGIDVTGIDPDPKALALAGRKAARTGMSVRFTRAFGDETGFPDATFDRVFSQRSAAC
jgi:ubiquinone/menaquinone biosynthesis C-methylase UbiE